MEKTWNYICAANFSFLFVFYCVLMANMIYEAKVLKWSPIFTVFLHEFELNTKSLKLMENNRAQKYGIIIVPQIFISLLLCAHVHDSKHATDGLFVGSNYCTWVYNKLLKILLELLYYIYYLFACKKYFSVLKISHCTHILY